MNSNVLAHLALADAQVVQGSSGFLLSFPYANVDLLKWPTIRLQMASNVLLYTLLGQYTIIDYKLETACGRNTHNLE